LLPVLASKAINLQFICASAVDANPHTNRRDDANANSFTKSNAVNLTQAVCSGNAQ
jgi:hypothetical protein